LRPTVGTELLDDLLERRGLLWRQLLVVVSVVNRRARGVRVGFRGFEAAQLPERRFPRLARGDELVLERRRRFLDAIEVRLRKRLGAL